MPAGILAVFNDCAPEGYEHFERWYIREHLQERVGVPGFRFGRRYQLVSGGDRQFFAFYEVETPAVLASPAYLERLNAPTPWTTETMKVAFRNSVRTVCDLRYAAGDLIGSHAAVLRADGAMAPTPEAGELVRKMAGEPGIARVQLWTASATQTPSDTAEMKTPRQGPARRRRIRRRMRAPRGCGARRGQAAQAPRRPPSASRVPARSASMRCSASIRVRAL